MLPVPCSAQSNSSTDFYSDVSVLHSCVVPWGGYCTVAGVQLFERWWVPGCRDIEQTAAAGRSAIDRDAGAR